MKRKKPVVAIDGPSGSGKSTIARLVAKKLGFKYLDTGAMYRAATLISMREGIEPERESDLVEAVKAHKIEISGNTEGTRVFIDGEEVSGDIRKPELTRRVGPVCELPGIRELMSDLQQEMGKEGGVVLEGRDIGTVIFPDAEVKIFLTASAEERARRRWKELKAKGIDEDYHKVLDDIQRRDARDSGRELAPLVKAEDAVEIDTSDLSLEGVVEAVVREVEKKGCGGSI